MIATAYAIGAALMLAHCLYFSGRPRGFRDALIVALIVALWPAAICMSIGMSIERRAR